MLKKVLIVLAVLAAIVVGFVIYLALKPGDFRVERKIKINAPADIVFNQVNNFHKWQAWSPWAKLDPNMKLTISGPSEGKGSKYHWVGNDAAGEGKMEITESDPAKRIRIKLDFIKPFESSNTTEMKFQAEGEATEVTWDMSGRNDNLIAKAFCMFMDMDQMIGSDFEKGLAQIKKIAEEEAKD